MSTIIYSNVILLSGNTRRRSCIYLCKSFYCSNNKLERNQPQRDDCISCVNLLFHTQKKNLLKCNVQNIDMRRQSLNTSATQVDVRDCKQHKKQITEFSGKEADENELHNPRSKLQFFYFRYIAGVAILLFIFGFLRELENEPYISDYPYWLAVWKELPLRVLARMWGYIHHIELPEQLREPIFMLWTRAFNCNLEEIDRPLKEYRNLSEFFTRALKPGVRSIDNSADLVSPVDARITAYGRLLPDGTVEQIKGHNYHLQDFIGVNPVKDPVHGLDNNISEFKDLKFDAQRKFYYCVLYLHPGDYHRYHAPTEALFTERRHYVGQLLPVSPHFVKWIPSLFCRQERVVLNGIWRHGFFSYVAVGAFNVGSIRFNWDRELHTNTYPAPNPLYNRTFVKKYSNADSITKTEYDGVFVRRGEEMGCFDLGSTIVLVWECNEDGIFAISEEQDELARKSVKKDLGILEPAGIRIRLGQPIFFVKPRPVVHEAIDIPPGVPHASWNEPIHIIAHGHNI